MPGKIIKKRTFLSTLSLRRATQRQIEFERYSDISIHALLAESDLAVPQFRAVDLVFLSTLSLRRATEAQDGYKDTVTDFYPRSPCGERHETYVVMEATKVISIHALLAESDLDEYNAQQGTQLFLSTLSLRRATMVRRCSNMPLGIFLSTLSLRRATAKVHKTVGYFCAYETNFMEIASSC